MLFKILIGLPKTLFFNFFCFPFKTAVRFPIILAPNVKIKYKEIRNHVFVDNPSQKVLIGFSGSFLMGDKTLLSIGKNGKLTFKGNANISKGCKLIVNSNLVIGENFFCNSNCIINSGKEIIIGNNCTFGWNTTILDGDGHKIFYKNEEQLLYEPVLVNNNVWLASDVTILKGAIIPEYSIVASKACISKPFYESNLLLGGYNKILKKEISWEL